MPRSLRGTRGAASEIRGKRPLVYIRAAIHFAIAAGAGAAISAAAAPPPRSVAEIAQYQGADRQALLEAGARHEGHLMIYCTGTQADPVFQAFQHKYPFIQIEALRNDDATVARQMIEEYGAQTHLADVIQLTTTGLHPLLDAGLLQAYQSPELAQIRPEVIGPDRHWALDYQSFLSLGYNTNLVSEADAPKTLDDLIDPKWKGKMAMPGTSTLPNWIGSVLRQKDESFLRQVAQQQVRIYEMSARAVANFIVSGEVALSPAIYSSHVAASRRDGAPVAWRALGGVYSITDGAALAAAAPHPNAAMLYIDFALSHEGQAIYQKLGYASSRKDIVNPEQPATVYYFGDEPDYLQNYEKWTTLARQIFGQ